MHYNVIKLDITNGLEDRNISLGAGNYLILQYSPVEIKIRINQNTNPQIVLKQNSGIEYNRIDKVYITCNAVLGGEIVLLHGDSSNNFRYIAPTYGKIDVGTMDEVLFIRDINNVNSIQSFSETLKQDICKIVNKYKFINKATGSVIAKDNPYTVTTNVFEETLKNDKVIIDIGARPNFYLDDIVSNDPSYGYNQYVDELYYAYIEVVLDNIVVESFIQGYAGSVTNFYPIELTNVKGKTLKINLKNAKGYDSGTDPETGHHIIAYDYFLDFFWTIDYYDDRQGCNFKQENLVEELELKYDIFGNSEYTEIQSDSILHTKYVISNLDIELKDGTHIGFNDMVLSTENNYRMTQNRQFGEFEFIVILNHTTNQISFVINKSDIIFPYTAVVNIKIIDVVDV
jgi:hypothetical protein